MRGYRFLFNSMSPFSRKKVYGGEEVPLSCLRVEICHFFHICEYPYKRVFSFNTDLGFISMYKVPMDYLLEDSFIGAFVNFSPSCLLALHGIAFQTEIKK